MLLVYQVLTEQEFLPYVPENYENLSCNLGKFHLVLCTQISYVPANNRLQKSRSSQQSCAAQRTATNLESINTNNKI